MELEEINKRFNNELLQQINGMLPKGHIYSLGYPGTSLLTAGLANLPIELHSDRLMKKASYDYKHPFDLHSLKDLPKSINEPIMVFKSTKLNGSKVILVELQYKGNNYVVILRLQHKGSGRNNTLINDIRSIYPKDNVRGVFDWIGSKDNLLLWADKEKAMNFISVQSTNLAGNGNEIQGSTYNIIKKFVNARFFQKKCNFFLFFSILFLTHSLCYAQQNGFSYWWQNDGLIDYAQMTELDALDGDQELWCALSELYVGRETAEEAGCEFEEENAEKHKKSKKIWKVNFSSGANLDTNGDLKKKFAKIAGSLWDFSGEARIKEDKETKGTMAFKHWIFYAKGGDLTDKYKGMLSELNLSGLKLGGEWLHRGNSNDSSWIFGKFSENFWEKRIYAGGNMRIVAPYYGGNRLWSRTWQGFRFWNWNFRITEIAVAKENENTLDFAYIAERKKPGARLAFEHDKNKSAISAGFKPIIKGSDSLWAKAEYPLRLRSGLDKKIQYVQVSNSFLLKETWKQGKPLEFRSESRIKIPLAMQPLFILRWTANFYKNENIDLKQLYVGGSVGF